MTNLIQDKVEKPQTHEEEEKKYYEGSSWSDAATRNVDSTWSWKRQEGGPPRIPRGSIALLPPGFQTLASKIVRESISVVLSPLVGGNLLPQPQESNTVPKQSVERVWWDSVFKAPLSVNIQILAIIINERIHMRGSHSTCEGLFLHFPRWKMSPIFFLHFAINCQNVFGAPLIYFNN